MDDTLVLWILAGLTVGIVAGQLLFIAFDNYQSYKTRKEIAARNRQYDKERVERLERGEYEPPFGGGSFAFRVYRDLAEAERERQSNKPDHLLCVMQDFFVELRERDKNNDKTS
ncbi:hypothetical protein [Psychrobacter sp. UBA2514]|jgi:hypothetical protein|uniref:hypothetical protein n=1 Tax=Psychrobacter sp. UBA2514 TaxID=1947346 RepID=UPI0025803C0B|nr:hypothetical protein [Psychrobacter sp. UBA2514]|tara:strand:+ start:7091 stop:7432 length:342 start_codon:yes stop_codon:yes gene_type:complete